MGKKNVLTTDAVPAKPADTFLAALPVFVAEVNGLIDTPMPEPEGGWPTDEFTGVGGSYVRDPITGVRSRSPDAPE